MNGCEEQDWNRPPTSGRGNVQHIEVFGDAVGQARVERRTADLGLFRKPLEICASFSSCSSSPDTMWSERPFMKRIP